MKSTVEIAGLVKGMYISAAQCSIDGVIEGDVLLACASADITGHVKGIFGPLQDKSISGWSIKM
jgi:hypothetical protein